MPSLLHIRSSPGGESVSAAVAGRFVEAWRGSGPDRDAETLNLWEAELPDLDRDTLAARQAVEEGRTPAAGAQQAAWDRVATLAGRLLAADRLLLSAPMWNFGLPYRLKLFVDCVTQPGLTYTGSPETGFRGLVPQTPAALVLARGGSYAPGTERAELDFQQRYLQAWLRFLGYLPVETILVEPTSGDLRRVREAVDRAGERAAGLAAGF